MGKDAKVKKFKLRTEPLKPSHHSWDCVCGHSRFHHISTYDPGIYISTTHYEECEICECPKYTAGHKTHSMG